MGRPVETDAPDENPQERIFTGWLEKDFAKDAQLFHSSAQARRRNNQPTGILIVVDREK
jgi:hypothetical protein